jgi:hypothetical protein
MTKEAKYAKEQVIKLYPNSREHKFRILNDLSTDVLITSYPLPGPESRWRPDAESAWIDTWKRIQEELIRKLAI